MFPPAAMALLALSAQADSVTLRDGKTYEGMFIGASPDHVTLQMDGRTKRRFNVGEIESIRFERADTSASSSPIDQKYNSMKSSESPLGNPTGEEQSAADHRGRYRSYQNGAIYYTPQTGAHAVQGSIAERWLGLGAEHSELGYPAGDEMILPDGRHVESFEHGTIVWDRRDVPVVEISAR